MSVREADDFPVVVFEASYGGIQALSTILASLPEEFPAVIAIVQHRSSEPGLLAEVLSFRSKRPVRDAAEGDRLAPGHVVLAPAGRHLLINRDGTLSLRDRSLADDHGAVDVRQVTRRRALLAQGVGRRGGAGRFASVPVGTFGAGRAGVRARGFFEGSERGPAGVWPVGMTAIERSIVTTPGGPDSPRLSEGRRHKRPGGRSGTDSPASCRFATRTTRRPGHPRVGCPQARGSSSAEVAH